MKKLNHFVDVLLADAPQDSSNSKSSVTKWKQEEHKNLMWAKLVQTKLAYTSTYDDPMAGVRSGSNNSNTVGKPKTGQERFEDICALLGRTHLHSKKYHISHDKSLTKAQVLL